MDCKALIGIKQNKLSATQKRYLRRYSKKINTHCCEHKGKDQVCYHIGYIGKRYCKVAVCCDCDEWQILCTGIAKWILKKILNKGVRRVNIITTLSNRDMFMYR